MVTAVSQGYYQPHCDIFFCESELHGIFLMAIIIWALERGLDIPQECEHWRAQWFGILSWWLLSSSSSSSIIYFERHLMLMKWYWNWNLDQYVHHHISLWSGDRQKLSYSIAQAYKGIFLFSRVVFARYTYNIFFRHFRYRQNEAALRWTCGSCSVVEQERIVGDSAGGWEEVEQNLHPGVRFQPPSILSIEYSMPSIWLDIFIQYHG